MMYRPKVDFVSFLAGIGVSSLLASSQNLVAAAAYTGYALARWVQSLPFMPSVWTLGTLALVAGAAEVLYQAPKAKLDALLSGLAELQHRHRTRFAFLPAAAETGLGARLRDTSARGAANGYVRDPLLQPGHAMSGRLQQMMFQQLSIPWKGLHAEPPHRMALLALLGLYVVVDEAGYLELRGRLARLYQVPPRSDMDCGQAEETCRRWALRTFEGTELGAWLDDLQWRHAHSTTVLMGALTSARRQGNLSTAEFGWLLAVDESLFFALDAVGRPAPLVQGLAGACHYACEVQAGERIQEVDWTIPFNAVRLHQDAQ